MATDFRSGKDFPRPGRETLGGFLWLTRVFDKGRAARDNTIFDYIYPCPMDKGVFEIWGVTPAQFDEALKTIDTDEAIQKWAEGHVNLDRRDKANQWLLKEKIENLDRQDREEGVVAA